MNRRGRYSRVLRAVGLLVIGATFTTPAVSATTGDITVTVEQLTKADVIFTGGAASDGVGAARLQRAADALSAKGFPTKFIVSGERLADPDDSAKRLRVELANELGGLDKIKGIFILGPRQLGTGANAFDKEVADAFAAERTVFEDDPVTGVINVANRLQERDAAGLLSADEKVPDDPFNWLLYVLLPAVIVVGVAAVVGIRRAVAKGKAVTAMEISGGAHTPDDDSRTEGEPPHA